MHQRALQFQLLLLAALVGYVLLTRLAPRLHMAMAAALAAISGVSLIGTMIVVGAARSSAATALGFIGVVAATASIVGGFLIVDRVRLAADDESRASDGR